MMTDEMLVVKKFIEKYIGNLDNIQVSKNLSAWYVRVPNRMVISKLKEMIDKLPKNIGHFVDPTGTHIFAPIGTPELDYSFAKVKMCAVGNELIKRQKAVLELMQRMQETSKEMLQYKEQLKEELKQHTPA